MKLVLTQPALEYESGIANYRVVAESVAPLAGTLSEEDVVLLPEHYDLRESRSEYEGGVRELARTLGCHVVGGSHHAVRDGHVVNSGIVVNRQGDVLASYEKLRPYAEERARVAPGSTLGEVTIVGHPMLVLVCADFWFSDVYDRASRAPEVVLVPSFSVSRKPTPDYSRALWQHLSVARAYEFGTFVGVSDWAHVPVPGRLSASGVAGFADPTRVSPAELFSPVSGAVTVFDLDFERLAEFRRDRASRGFFWKPHG
ncbi:MAG TPA: nitrilase-related carbon-nitrogen hydrolase [Polyangiaceae bacterium]|nr:nitrilase-related carbon-nitrogen hydrolase [Polyangiaceae bacterium]